MQSELRRSPAETARSLDELVADVGAWSSATADRFAAVDDHGDREERRLLVRRAVLGWAPTGVVAGAWLQWMTGPGNADATIPLRTLALYACDIGAGRPSASRGDHYVDLLRQVQAAEHAVPVARLSGDTRIADTAFRLPAVLLLMSRRPDRFRPEIVGADLCLRALGLPPPLAVGRGDAPVDRPALDYASTRDDERSAAARCRAVVDLVLDDEPGSAARVRAGFGWAFDTVRGSVEALHGDLVASLDPAFAMAELMGLRAREASVYHGRVTLEERPLAAWLRDCRDDPRPFLEVLARSRWIKPGDAATSPLVNGMISPRGPMFRVFSPDDVGVIRRWIDALPAGGRGGPAEAQVESEPASDDHHLASIAALSTTTSPFGDAPRDTRDAYHRLMTRVVTPAVDDWSVRYVRGWLARSRHGADAAAGPLPARWTTDGLRPWLQAQHDRHSEDFERIADAELPSRAAVVDDAVQTAPLTLIDGSWLQGFTDHGLASSEIGFSLFATYWDELGNGEPSLNHPLIYREVLLQMGVDLPPTASPEFAAWPGFRDESFELPVYWLSVGRHPRTFLPEILGLNLAMELSGVGGSYRRASIALHEYGFSTRFVDIHNTIDNVATGHSAWAADAVDTFMSTLPDAAGTGGRAEAWQRVRAGYRSLTPPAGPMARWAARRATRPGRRRAAVPAVGRTRGDA